MPKGLGTQIIAGVLGLLFVIGLVLLGRRLGQDLRTRFAQSREETETTVTPSPPLNELVGISPTPSDSSDLDSSGQTLSTQTKGGTQEIPKTGAETLLFSSLFLPIGYYLRKSYL